jgi:hypothetical protein
MVYGTPQEVMLVKIRGALLEMGWNSYKKIKPYRGHADETVMAGPVRTLEIGSPYIIYPFAEDPRDPGAVLSALEKVAVKLERRMPTITIEGVHFDITGFTPHPRYVHLHVPEGICVSYETMLAAIPTMVDANP